MQHHEQVRLLKELLDRTEQGQNVDAGAIVKNPVDSYVSPDLAAREWNAFFRGHPQIVGMSGDLPERGSFFTCNDFGVPVLATRDRTGTFRAFVNSCRHRGAIVETRERGTSSRFVCRFHGWTYDAGGALAAIPESEQFGTIDASCHGLIELPAAERFGFLWVHPHRDGTLDPDTLLDGLVDDFSSWGFERLVHGGQVTYDMPLNWKLANDTFGETYHFKRLHKDTLALSFEGDVQTYDEFGRNLRMVLCYRTIRDLRARPESSWRITDSGFLVYFLFPNVQVNVGVTGVTLVRIYPDPDDPNRSISRIGFYIHPEALAADPERVKTRMYGFGDVVESEDYSVGVTTQTAARSGMLDHVLFGRNEPALHHFHNTFRAALGMAPLETLRDG